MLNHPSVIARYPDVDPEQWTQWIDRLNVLHGSSHEDHVGTYIADDLYNWDQGIRRLAGGLFADGGAAAAAHDHDPASLPPFPLQEDEIDNAARLATAARSLIADARLLASLELSLRDWASAFDALATSYLTPRHPGEQQQLDRCRAALADLASSDPDQRPMTYVEARCIAVDCLTDLRGARGEFLARGVTIAPLSPTRPIPYRALFVAGLSEGAFPAPHTDDALDLRRDRPEPGDMTPRQRDQWAFFQSIECARDWLSLSYISRDPVSGEVLSPSSVVYELMEMVMGPGVTVEEIARSHPMSRHEPGPPPSTESVDVIARRRERAANLRADVESYCADSGFGAPPPEALLAELGLEKRQILARQLGAVPAGALPRQTDIPPVVSLSVIRRFLEQPVHAWAEAALGIREGAIDDPSSREDEPFSTGPAARGVTTARRIRRPSNRTRGSGRAAPPVSRACRRRGALRRPPQRSVRWMAISHASRTPGNVERASGKAQQWCA